MLVQILGMFHKEYFCIKFLKIHQDNFDWTRIFFILKTNFVYSSSTDSNESGNGSTGNTCEPVYSDYQFLDQDHGDVHDVQMKTISLQEYKKLMDLIPEVEKLRNNITKLSSSLNSQLEQQQRIHQADLANSINISHFSAVSIL